MATTETRYEHIVLDEAGRPRIAGTTMKLTELVETHLAYGWSPEELAYQYPSLTLGQVYSALAYYWDHQAAIDAAIAADLAYADDLRQRMGNPPYVSRLRQVQQR